MSNNKDTTAKNDVISFEIDFGQGKDALHIVKKGDRYDHEKGQQYQLNDEFTLEGKAKVTIDAIDFYDRIFSNHGFTDTMKSMFTAIASKLHN